MAPLYARYRPPVQSVSDVSAARLPAEPPSLGLKDSAEDGSRKRKRGDDGPRGKQNKHDEGNESRGTLREDRKNAKRFTNDQKMTLEQPHISSKDDDGAKHQNVLSKFRKASKRSRSLRAHADSEDVDPHEAELHDLVPIPQPPRAKTPEYSPTFSALPEWLQHPETVSATHTVPFSDMALDPSTTKRLANQGYREAFAVQTALVPRLLPHSTLTYVPPNDLCVSAPTGSGKTLGYMLPIIEQLRQRNETRLRGLIVVPTRELVAQAQTVATMCAAGSSLHIATATGNQSRAAEQESLVSKGSRYDPVAYRQLMEKARKMYRHELDDDLSPFELAEIHDALRMVPHNVPTYNLKANILICTPGRLVEHMESIEFLLDDLQWLIIDEADRLLDQSFQGFVERINSALERSKAVEDDVLLAQHDYVRKIILSATMTRDVSALGALHLRRPTMIVVKSQDDGQDQTWELPTTLKEYAVAVGDGAEKPLFLLEMLKTRLLKSTDASSDSSDDERDDSDSVSDSDKSQAPMVLVFTASSEEASRLSHLLERLSNQHSAKVWLLTKSTSTTPRHLLRPATSARVIMSTDKASRGLDLPGLTHVVNYSMPRSLGAYVHRVGRTARAGRTGEAWTLFRENEGRWFWNEIARSTTLRRAGAVERTRVVLGAEYSDGVIRVAYEDALGGMRDLVSGAGVT